MKIMITMNMNFVSIRSFKDYNLTSTERYSTVQCVTVQYSAVHHNNVQQRGIVQYRVE